MREREPAVVLQYDAAPVNTAILIAPFVVIGVAVLAVAFSGGRGRVRRGSSRSSRTLGGGMKVLLPVLFIGFGLAVPAAVIAGRSGSVGSSGALAEEELTPELREGQQIFGQNCASCHSLRASNAHGATGPVLDELGRVSEQRVLAAIANGGSGDLRMPAGLLEGKDAELVALYVSRVAGR